MSLLLTLLTGFSVVSAAVLFAVYALFLRNVNRSRRALLTGAFLLLGLAFLQLGHLEHFTVRSNLLDSWGYRFWLFLCPSMFYLFSTSILFDESRFDGWALLHLSPVLLIFIGQIEVALSILFSVGTGYSLWLTRVIYGLRGSRKRGRFELFFLCLFSLMAVGVLVLGFSLPYMNPSYFYSFYALVIGLALILVVGALLAFPELLSELAVAAKLSYSASTLSDVDVEAKQQTLNKLMEDDQLYRHEELTLGTLAEAVELAPHQLSELLNSHYELSFSQFLREYRIREAQRLLRAEPDASVLSIGLEVGFKSQSNFYAAFKAYSGQSPGAYRRSATAS